MKRFPIDPAKLGAQVERVRRLIRSRDIPEVDAILDILTALDSYRLRESETVDLRDLPDVSVAIVRQFLHQTLHPETSFRTPTENIVSAVRALTVLVERLETANRPAYVDPLQRLAEDPEP